MHRFILFLLLCVLPLQFALAASVDALTHASGGHHHDATPHFHELTGDVESVATDADESTPRTHGECGACHFAHSLAVLESHADISRTPCVARILLLVGDIHRRSAAAARPERPNWSALV